MAKVTDKEVLEAAKKLAAKELVRSFRDIWQQDSPEFKIGDDDYTISAYGDSGDILIIIRDFDGNEREFSFVPKTN